MKPTVKDVFILYLICFKVSPLESQPSNFCNGYANLVKMSEWTPMMNYEVLLNTSTAFGQLVTDEGFLKAAIDILSPEITKWVNSTPTLDAPGGTFMANNGLYKVMHSTPSEAEKNCTLSNGELPMIELDEDEHVGLGEVLTRMNISQTLVRAFPARSGYFTGSGFYLGEYMEKNGTLPGYRLLDQPEDKDAEMNNVIGDPRGPLIAKLGPNGTAMLSSLTEEERSVKIDFVCRVPGISCYRSKAERDACVYHGHALLDKLEDYHSFVKGIRQSLTATETTDGEDDIQLATPPTNSTVLQVEIIQTGVGAFRYLLARLAAAEFYHDTRVNFPNELLNMKNVVSSTFEAFTLEGDKTTFDVAITTDAIPHLNNIVRLKRGVTEAFVNWAGAYILKPFRDYVVLVALRVLERISPTTLYAIRSFLTTDNLILKDRYLIDDGQRAYTMYDKPEILGCDMVRGTRTCRSYGAETDGRVDYECGQKLMGRGSSGSCLMTSPRDPYEVYPQVACPARSNAPDGYLNDVIVSDRKANMVRDCGKRGSTVYELKEGSNAFPTAGSIGCDFKVENNIVYHSPDYSGGNVPNISPESTLSNGKSPSVTSKKHVTPLGDFDTWQIVALSATILGLGATTLLAIMVACNPRLRLLILRNICCCLLPQGLHNWMNRSRFARLCCNCRLLTANSWDSIPSEDHDQGGMELQDINPPMAGEGPIGPACASNAPNAALPVAGPHVEFEELQPVALDDLRRALRYLSSEENYPVISQYGNKEEMASLISRIGQALNDRMITYAPDDRCIDDTSGMTRGINGGMVESMTVNAPRARQARPRTVVAQPRRQVNQPPLRPRRRTRSYPPPPYRDSEDDQLGVLRCSPSTGARSKR